MSNCMLLGMLSDPQVLHINHEKVRIEGPPCDCEADTAILILIVNLLQGLLSSTTDRPATGHHYSKMSLPS